MTLSKFIFEKYSSKSSVWSIYLKTSRYEGIVWSTDEKRWLAYIEVDGKEQLFGRFSNELVAVLALNDYYFENDLPPKNPDVNLLEPTLDSEKKKVSSFLS